MVNRNQNSHNRISKKKYSELRKNIGEKKNYIRTLYNSENIEFTKRGTNDNSKMNLIKLCSDSLIAGLFMRNSFAARGSGNGSRRRK